LGNQNKQAQKIAQGQIHDNKRQFFLRKGNLQFFPIPAQSKKTRDNFFIWEDNLQLFFFMLAQSEREGGEPAQVTINKEKVVLTQVMILC